MNLESFIDFPEQKEFFNIFPCSLPLPKKLYLGAKAFGSNFLSVSE